MSKENGEAQVIQLSSAMEKRRLTQTKEVYSHYLDSLSNEQLGHELQYLLEVYASDNFGDEFFVKGPMLLANITNRTYGAQRHKLEAMNADLLKLIQEGQPQ